jgi:hypothetical protein
MKYNGEHLFYGELGHFLAVLSFVASLVATISYFKASRNSLQDEYRSWLKLARTAFLLKPYVCSAFLLRSILSFPAITMNTIMRGIIHHAAWKKNIYLPAFGKVRKEALCFGIPGTVC